mmetsp:Transcript_10840/g.34887  ORF Transcript_10840/g.34887 Transcript_10840/m.34887 type:complete len:510 (-) Transcript_10840:363-1892(-)
MSACSCGADAALEEHEGQLVCLSCGRVIKGVLDLGEDATDLNFAGRSQFVPLLEPAKWAAVEKRVREMGAELALDHACVQVATALTKAALGRPRQGAPLESHAACCLLLASRRSQAGAVLTLREVTPRARCLPVVVGQCWMRLLGRLEAERTQQQLNVDEGRRGGSGGGSGLSESGDGARKRNHLVNPAALLDRYCYTLHRSVGAAASSATATGFLPRGSVRALASMLLELAEVEWLLDGRPTDGVVVGCILVALSSLGLRARELSTQAVSDLLGVKLYSAKKRSAELKAVALGVAQALPGRGGLPDGVLLRSLPAALEQARLERAAAMLALNAPLEEEVGGEGMRGVEPDLGVGGSDASDGVNTSGVGPAASRRGGGAMGAGAVVATEGGATRKAAGMRGPPAFLASMAKRQRLQTKLDAARQRVAAAPDGADAGSGVQDEEARRVEEALRRGVPDEAIVQGFFDSVPLSQDREVSAADAPHLFQETLCEADLPDSAVRRFLQPAPAT